MGKKNLIVKIPVSGSLGILAAGHKAVRAWRKVRDEAKNRENGKEMENKK